MLQARHVWIVLVELDADERHTSHLRGLLSEAERGVEWRLRSVAERRRYLLSHVALRIVLGRLLDVPAGAARLEVGAQGKPEVASWQNERDLRFNLSRSGRWAAIALACASSVGVDIEAVRPDVADTAVARRYFSSGEYAELQESRAEDRSSRFFTLWCRKEAVAKAAGARALDGLRMPVGSRDRGGLQ